MARKETNSPTLIGSLNVFGAFNFFNDVQIQRVLNVTGNASVGGFLNLTGGNVTNVDHVLANNLTGSLYWTNLTNYPAACPAGSAVTTVDNSITCTSYQQVSQFNSSNYGTAGFGGKNRSLLIADFGGATNCFVNFTNGIMMGSNCTTTP